VLEFIADDGTEATFSGLFTNALVYELAARLAPPILKGDKGAKRQRELRAMAENFRDIAIADEKNRDTSESRYDQFLNETQRAREGWSLGYPGVVY
jgi:hypothetical protein